MNTNGHNGHILANIVVPGVKIWDDGEYARLRFRLDGYDDFIVARKFDGDGKPGAYYSLDPLDAAAALAGINIGSPLLPDGCLFWQRADGGERLAIYAPPQAWPVHVSAGPERETLIVSMPSLIWIGQGAKYSLYAVKGTERPAADTKLFKAPCPNVSDNICRGNVTFPAAAADTIWPALRLFFESDFNNHLSDGKSRKHPAGVLEMWRELAGGPWPEDDLIGAEVTLGEVMR